LRLSQEVRALRRELASRDSQEEARVLRRDLGSREPHDEVPDSRAELTELKRSFSEERASFVRQIEVLNDQLSRRNDISEDDRHHKSKKLQQQIALKESQLDSAVAKCHCLSAKIDLMQTAIDNPPIAQELRALHSRILGDEGEEFSQALNSIFGSLSLVPIQIELRRIRIGRLGFASQEALDLPLAPDIETLVGSIPGDRGQMGNGSLVEMASVMKTLFREREEQIGGMAMAIRLQDGTGRRKPLPGKSAQRTTGHHPTKH
jgi:hypothetical protein